MLLYPQAVSPAVRTPVVGTVVSALSTERGFGWISCVASESGMRCRNCCRASELAKPPCLWSSPGP